MKFFFFLLILLIPSTLAIGLYPQKITITDSTTLLISSSKNTSINLQSNILEVPETLFVKEGINELPLTSKKKGQGSLIIRDNGVDLFIPVKVTKKFNGLSIFFTLNILGLLIGGFLWKKERFFPSQ